MRPVLAAALLSLLAGGVARSQDASPDPELASAIASVESALALWIEAAPSTLELAKSAPETLRTITDESRTRLTGETTAASLEELHTRLAGRRNDLIFGAAAPAPEAPKDESRTLEVYDVSSIVAWSPDETATVVVPGFHPPPRPVAGATLTFGDDWRRSMASRGIDADKLRDLADRFGADDGGSVEISGGNLLARVTSAKHARIRALLAACRTLAERRIALDIASYRMPVALGRDLESLAAPDGSLSPAGERRLEAALASGEASIVGLETRSVQDGEAFAAWTGEVAKIRDDAPVTSVVTTGQYVRMRPILEAGARSILLDAALTRVTPRDASAEDLLFTRAATRARVAVGKTTLLGGTFAVASTTACVLAVKPQLVGSAAEPTVGLDPVPGVEIALPERPLGALAPKVEAEVSRLEPLIAKVAKLRALAGADFRVAFVDARDLLLEGLWRGEARFGTFTSGQATYFPRGLEPVSDDWNDAAIVEPDKLEQLVKNSTGADAAWGDPASYELHRGAIIINQTRDVQGRIHAVLAQLRKDRGRGARLETDVYEVSPAFVRELQGLATSPAVLGERALALLDSQPDRARLESAALVLAPLGGAPVHVAEGREAVWKDTLERTGALCEARADAAPGLAATVSARLVRARRDGGLAVADLATTATLEPGSAAFGISLNPTTGKAVLLVVRLRAVSPRD